MKVGQRATALGHNGTIEEVCDGGYKFRSDNGALFTVLSHEVKAV